MPRTATPKGDGKRYPLNMRTTKETRDRLEKAAAESGRSLAQEMEVRLERSFSNEDYVTDALGGPTMRSVVEMMIAAFSSRGKIMAMANGHHDWSTDDWMKDPQCYRAATWGVLEALLATNPQAQWERDEAYLEIEGLKTVVGQWLSNAGKLKL